MFRATNLRQSRKFYTNAVGDVGDIQKVWGSNAGTGARAVVQYKAAAVIQYETATVNTKHDN